MAVLISLPSSGVFPPHRQITIAVLIVAALAACNSAQSAQSRLAPLQTASTPGATAEASAFVSLAPTLTAPSDAASVARDLALSEAAIRAPDTQLVFIPFLARRAQSDYRLLVAHPTWVPAALAALSPDIRSIVQANLTADQEIRTLNGPARGLPHWRIVDPPPADQLMAYYREAEARFGIPWQYLAAIHLIETAMSRVQGTSTAGALGPMQFMPGTWAVYGRGDINNPHDAILAAARYLHASGAPGNMSRAIYSYNPSWLYVKAVMLYAQQMFANPRAFLAYYYRQVYYPTVNGDVLLPQGYSG